MKKQIDTKSKCVRSFKVSSLLAGSFVLLSATPCQGQSSSLHTEEGAAAQRGIRYHVPRHLPTSPMIRSIAEQSMFAVPLPEMRTFAKHDLVTIIVRESFQTDIDAQLNTAKDASIDGQIAAFPRITLKSLLDAQLGPSDGPFPSLDASIGSEFDGEGEYSRSESMVGRVTARVIDIKPNGTLVLEARKSIKSDKEEMMVTVTGTCRVDDIGPDNTILSSQLYDLRLDKQHKGELRKATKKGLLTQIFEFLFSH